MNHPASDKLVKVFGISTETANDLVAAGYNVPRKIKNAKDSDLRKHVSSNDVTKLRARWKEKS
jgi:hypothetical protein